MPVAIAGMHRSGTSMVTRLLNICGLYLGKKENLLSATKDNPEGFWENAEIQRMNDEILTSFNGGWDIPPVLQAGWETSPHLGSIIQNANLVIQEISQQESVWGWKDPRNSLTLPFWKRLVPNLKIIICLRNPFEVYCSLSRIGAASSAFSYNLWLAYYQRLMASTNSEECIITHYDSFFRDPQSELRRLTNFLGLEVSDETISTACQTISTNLRHNYGSIAHLRATNAPDQLLYLYRELCLQAGSVYGISVSLEETEFLENIAPTEEFVTMPIEKDIERIREDLRIANVEKEQLEKNIVRLQEERTIEIEKLQNEKTAEIAKLHTEITALQSTIQGIFASRSWKLIQTFQKIRLFFIPLGSRREKIVKAILKWLNMKEKIASIIPELLRYRKPIRIEQDRASHLAIGSFGGFEIAYRKDTVDEKVITKSFDNDIFFSGVPEYQPHEGHVIIDIGAHIGTFSLLSSSKIGRGKVYAIEASKDSFNLLRSNAARNHCTNISMHHLALADKDGTCTLHHSTENWGHSIVKRRSTSSESETVKCCTLTNFLEKYRIKECQFMKLNCEGAEFPILLSTPNNVLQRFDTILILYHCDLWSNNTENDLISHLESSSFNCVIRNQSTERGWIIATKAGKLA
jgi:FkbM family methyltransferase